MVLLLHRRLHCSSLAVRLAEVQYCRQPAAVRHPLMAEHLQIITDQHERQTHDRYNME